MQGPAARARAALCSTFLVCLVCSVGLIWPTAPLLANAETPAGAVATGNIEVIIEGLSTDDASVEVNLWRGADGWLDRSSDLSRYRTLTVRGEAGTARALFLAVPHRDYAVTAYQDDNENGRLDQGLFRIPKERLGFSNGLRPKFSAPEYVDAAVLLESDVLRVHIHLHRMP